MSKNLSLCTAFVATAGISGLIVSSCLDAQQADVSKILEAHIKTMKASPFAKETKGPALLVMNNPDRPSSVGEIDKRVNVTLGNKKYIPVFRMNDCTAFAISLESYSLRGEGSLLATAGHCLKLKKLRQYLFETEYIDREGSKKEIRLKADKIWIHPSRPDSIRGLGKRETKATTDFALVYSKEKLPVGFPVYKFLPVDTDMIKKENLNQLVIASAGFSGDRETLSADENIRITEIKDQAFTTNADIKGGASGGPLTVEWPKGYFFVIAVNAAVRHGSDDARHTALKPEFLRTVPFLKPNQPVDIYDAVVNSVNGVNIRYGGGVQFEKLKPDSKTHADSALRQGVFVRVFADKVGDKNEWSLVKTQNGRFGYIKSSFLTRRP